MKNCVNVLFVCGYGVGSSAMAASMVKKQLVQLNVNAEVKHTGVGEMNSLNEWSDIVAISTKLAEGIDFKGKPVIHMVNIMDAKGISAQIKQVVEAQFPDAITA